MRTKAVSGFTLVELLVVIAIIGILSSVVLAALNTTRIKARDAKRISDMSQIRNALELYYNTNGHYPIIASGWTSFDAPAYMGNGITNPVAASIAAALSAYLPAGVSDPKRTGASNSGYLYRTKSTSDGSAYCLLIYGTPENMNNFPSNFVDSGRCGTITNGTCSGTNAVFIGTGIYETVGC